MSDSPFSQLRYCLFPSANPPTEGVELHNNAFQLWQSVWADTLAKLNFAANNLTEEFVRQDLVACIANGNVPVAVHLYSFFTIDCTAARKHSYFTSNYPEIFFAKLAKVGVRSVMSMEYMTVHPDWRKQKASVHLGGALGGLAVRSMHYFGADAAIAPCRRDHKINEMAYHYGGEPVIANVQNHNVACDLVMIRRENVKPHPTTEVQDLLDALWEKREFHPSLHLEKSKHREIPATRKAA